MAAFHQLSMHIVPPRSNVREARLKLKFHGTETDTDTDMDFLADFRARILARKSARRAAARAARSARHEPDTHDDPRRLVRGLLPDARFSSRVCPLGMRVYCT